MSKLSKRDSQFCSGMEVRPFEGTSQIQVDPDYVVKPAQVYMDTTI